MATDFDLFVLGAGSAGVRASRVAAALGAKVGIAEERYLGGTCVNVGCIPKKLLVYAAHFADEWHEAESYGWQVAPPKHDFGALIRRKDVEIARLNGIYEQLLTRAGVAIYHGRGVVQGPHEISLTLRNGEHQVVSAKHLLVAVGGKPRRPTFPGSEHVWVSDDVFRLEQLPKRVTLLGGGYIALEMAGIFAGLGASVTVVYRGELFLRGFDEDVRRHLSHEMQKKGIVMRCCRHVSRVEKAASGVLSVHLDDGQIVETDGVVAAIGRLPQTAGLGLEQAGVVLSDDGAVVVDEHFQTKAPWIFAAGDVIDRVALTPVALAEGMIVARRLFGGPEHALDYDTVPSAVFSNPPVGTVGMTEERAREVYGKVDIYRSVFRPLKLTLTDDPGKVLMKLVVDAASQKVVGLHVVGPDAGEIVQGFAVALRAGVTKAMFDATIGIHPTMAEELVTMREKVASAT